MAIIRAAIDDDLPAIYGALSRAAGVAYVGDPPEFAASLVGALDGDGVALVTLGPQGELFGVAVLLVPGDGTAELVALWTLESHRRRGFARSILAVFEPVWKDLRISTQLPEGCQSDAIGGLLRQFGFKQSTRSPMLWRTGRVRRTVGRANLAK